MMTTRPLKKNRQLFFATKGFLKSLAAVAIWILLWQLLAMRLNRPLLLPDPLSVLRRLVELASTPVFWKHTTSSFLRVVTGIGTGVISAVTIAALSYRFPLLKILLDPVITVIKTVPVSSFIILAMLWINKNLIPVFIAFLMVFPVVWANVYAGLQAVPSSLRDLSTVYRFRAFKKIRRLYIPCAFPYFLSACHSSLGFAWKAGIAAEVLALPLFSIGKQLFESKLYLETIDLFAWTIVVIVMSLLLERISAWLIRIIAKHNRYKTEGPL